MQSVFKIEKDVPLPKRRGPGGYNQKYPLGRLEVGESFFVPMGQEDKEKFRHRIKAAVRDHLPGGSTPCRCNFSRRVLRLMSSI